MLLETKKGPVLTPIDVKKISDAIAYARENHLKKINSYDLSELYLITEEKLQKGFRRMTGYSVHYFLEWRRYETAIEMLSQPEMTIKEVAARLSMSNSYFGQFFKRYANITPAKFRSNKFSLE